MMMMIQAFTLAAHKGIITTTSTFNSAAMASSTTTCVSSASGTGTSSAAATSVIVDEPATDQGCEVSETLHYFLCNSI